MTLKEGELTKKIIGCCFDVSNELGIGFVEGVYERSLVVALREIGIEVNNQVPIKVIFRGHEVGNFYADLIVEGKVLVELKAVSKLLSEHQAQLLNYQKASGIEVGLLINFGTTRIEWDRFAL